MRFLRLARARSGGGIFELRAAFREAQSKLESPGEDEDDHAPDPVINGPRVAVVNSASSQHADVPMDPSHPDYGEESVGKAVMRDDAFSTTPEELNAHLPERHPPHGRRPPQSGHSVTSTRNTFLSNQKIATFGVELVLPQAKLQGPNHTGSRSLGAATASKTTQKFVAS